MLRIGGGGPPGARVQFDDMSLAVSVPEGGLQSAIYRPALLDPSAEQPPLALRSPFDALVRGDAARMADVLVNPQVFDKVALWQDYAYGQFRSFWGNFGWLTVPLPDGFFTGLDLVAGLALVGLAYRAFRRFGRWSWREWLGTAALVSLVFAVLTGDLKQMMLMAVQFLPAPPQGRYLFVLVVPVVWLLLAGLSEIGRAMARTGRRSSPAEAAGSVGTDGTGAETGAIPAVISWGGWILLNLILFSAGYSLFALVLPYYHGQ
jgi:hypothetical protein